MKIIFFGTPPFAATLLKTLLENGKTIAAIVTKPDKPQGRSQKLLCPAVKEFALKFAPEIPLFQPDVVSTAEFLPTLEAFKADLFIVVAYGEIIKQSLLDMPLLGCINVHASLLPTYRGAAPIQRAIMNGEIESGVTIMQMVRKMDAGDIIRVAKVQISSEMTYGELEEQLCEASIEPLLKVVEEYEKGIIPDHNPQDLLQVTFAPKIELEECQIDWHKPAKELHCLIRGVNPEPGAWCYVTVKGEKKRLRVMRTSLVEDASGLAGTVLKCDKMGIVVACETQGLKILELQLEGKRRMTVAEFIPGIPEGLTF
ncbi:MAG: methionyl-tRNA formyltransferase [Parachlamydiaceae bacterium]|nr:methionyl-tRNA formyltransferase [Parachlamydiaceae bacterium]